MAEISGGELRSAMHGAKDAGNDDFYAWPRVKREDGG